MASYEKITNLVDLPVSFSPKTAFPLDSRSMFGSKAEADAAALTAENAGSSNTVYYIGQTITVFENDKVNFYQIQADKSLKEVGTAPVGDDKSISVGDGGVVSIKSYGVEYYKYIAADVIIDNSAGTYTASNLPKGVADGSYIQVGSTWYKYTASSQSWATVTTAPKTSSSYTKTTGWKAGLEPRVVADGDNGTEIAWYEPSTETLEGLSAAINTLDAAVSQNSDSITAVTARAGQLEEKVGINSEGTETGTGLLTDVSDLKEKVGDSTKGLVHDVGENTPGSESGLYREIADLKAADAATNKALSDAKTELNTAIGEKATKATTLAGYGITDAYTKTETNSAISTAVANAAHLKYTIKAKKTDIDITAADADQYIYLVPKTAGKTDDGYDEYMVIDVSGTKKLEKVGDWDMDLSGYATTEALNDALSAYTVKTANTAEFTNTNGEISIKAIPQSKITDLGTDLGKKEDKSNKIDSLKGATSEADKKLKYPSVYAVEVALGDKLNKSDNLIEKQTFDNVIVGKFKGDVLQLDDSKQAQLTDVRNISFTTTSGTSGDPGITFNIEPVNGLWSNIVTVDGENTTTLKDSLDAKVDTTSDKLLIDGDRDILSSFSYNTDESGNSTLSTTSKNVDFSNSSVNASAFSSAVVNAQHISIGGAPNESLLFADIESSYQNSEGQVISKTLQSVLDSKVNTNSDQLLTADQKAAIAYLNFDKTNQKISPNFIDTPTLQVDDMQVISGIELLGDGTFIGVIAKNEVDGETTSLQSVLNNKVNKEAGYGLSKNDYTNADKTKVDKFAIYSGSNTALKDAVTVPGALGVSFSNIIDPATGTKLSDAITASNKIESVKVGGTAITIGEDKSVNIPIGSASALGVVKSSDAKDKVTINADGTMTVNSYNAIKLYVDDTDTLNING